MHPNEDVDAPVVLIHGTIGRVCTSVAIQMSHTRQLAAWCCQQAFNPFTCGWNLEWMACTDSFIRVQYNNSGTLD